MDYTLILLLASLIILFFVVVVVVVLSSKSTPSPAPGPTPKFLMGQGPTPTPDSTPGPTPDSTPGPTPDSTPGPTPRHPDQIFNKYIRPGQPYFFRFLPKSDICNGSVDFIKPTGPGTTDVYTFPYSNGIINRGVAYSSLDSEISRFVNGFNIKNLFTNNNETFFTNYFKSDDAYILELSGKECSPPPVTAPSPSVTRTVANTFIYQRYENRDQTVFIEFTGDILNGSYYITYSTDGRTLGPYVYENGYFTGVGDSRHAQYSKGTDIVAKFTNNNMTFDGVYFAVVPPPGPPGLDVYVGRWYRDYSDGQIYLDIFQDGTATLTRVYTNTNTSVTINYNASSGYLDISGTNYTLENDVLSPVDGFGVVYLKTPNAKCTNTSIDAVERYGIETLVPPSRSTRIPYLVCCAHDAWSGNVYFTATDGSLIIYRGASDAPDVVYGVSSPLSDPRGIHITQNYIYIANYSGNSIGRIKKSDGTYENIISNVDKPTDVYVSGTVLYVASNTNSILVRTINDNTGVLLDSWTIPTGNEKPLSVTEIHGMIYFTTQTGNLKYIYQSVFDNHIFDVPNLQGALNYIRTDGTNIYATSTNDNKIYKYSCDGSEIIPIAGNGDDNILDFVYHNGIDGVYPNALCEIISNPIGISVDQGSRTIYVIESSNHSLSRIFRGDDTNVNACS